MNLRKKQLLSPKEQAQSERTNPILLPMYSQETFFCFERASKLFQQLQQKKAFEDRDDCHGSFLDKLVSRFLHEPQLIADYVRDKAYIALKKEHTILNLEFPTRYFHLKNIVFQLISNQNSHSLRRKFQEPLSFYHEQEF